MQSLLGRSHWDAQALRDRVRADVLEALGDGDGVLVVDETGFIKKGEHSVGVARQYSGTAGRIENCQIGVFLAYASRFGQALIDRQLYVPEAWAKDEGKRAKAGVPEGITFVTKPQIACALIADALDAGAPCAWVLADAVYGSDSRLRRMLETRGQPYVLAVRSNHHLRFWNEQGLEETNPAAMADALARDAWATHAAGEGSKGLRLYEWARIALSSTAAPGFEHWLLIRRSRREPDKRAYYFAFAPVGVSLGELAGAAGLRWTIEECFERAKDDLGSRPLRGALLAWVAQTHEPVPGGRGLPGPVGRRPTPSHVGQSERKESGGPSGRLMSLAALLPTVPEIRYLLARLLLRPPIRTRFIMAWSIWRRQHQAKAAAAHYRRQVKRNCSIRCLDARRPWRER